MILGIAGTPVHENGTQEGSADEGPAPAGLPSLVRCLPPALQASVTQIATVGRGPYGHATTQDIFDRHLTTFEEIYRLGAQHPDVCALLYEIGIRRKNGARLGIGTVSSAISRARMKAADGRRNSKTGTNKRKRSRPARDATTHSGITRIQGTVPEQSEDGTVLLLSRAHETPPIATHGGSSYIASQAASTGVDSGNPPNIENAASLPPTARQPSPMARGSPTNGNLANVRNAGDLLNKIRSNHE